MKDEETLKRSNSMHDIPKFYTRCQETIDYMIPQYRLKYEDDEELMERHELPPLIIEKTEE